MPGACSPGEKTYDPQHPWGQLVGMGPLRPERHPAPSAGATPCQKPVGFGVSVAPVSPAQWGLSPRTPAAAAQRPHPGGTCSLWAVQPPCLWPWVPGGPAGTPPRPAALGFLPPEPLSGLCVAWALASVGSLGWGVWASEGQGRWRTPAPGGAVPRACLAGRCVPPARCALRGASAVRGRAA